MTSEGQHGTPRTQLATLARWPTSPHALQGFELRLRTSARRECAAQWPWRVLGTHTLVNDQVAVDELAPDAADDAWVPDTLLAWCDLWPSWSSPPSRSRRLTPSVPHVEDRILSATRSPGLRGLAVAGPRWPPIAGRCPPSGRRWVPKMSTI